MKSKQRRNRKGGGAPLPVPTEKEPKLTKMLDFPASAFSGLPQMELSGNREAVIDGCQGILEYDENIIKLSTGKMAVKFTGRDLQIKVLTHDSAVVNGFITGIEFLL